MSDNYLPGFMTEIKEVSYIMQAQKGEFDFISQAVKDGLDYSFAAFINESEEVLSRWERILRIFPDETDSSQARKKEILTRLSDRPPYTYNALNLRLTELFGVDGIPRHYLEEDCENYEVKLILDQELSDSADAVERFVRQRIPANMTLEVMVEGSLDESLEESEDESENESEEGG